MTLLAPTEFLGIIPPRRIVGKRTRIVEGEKQAISSSFREATKSQDKKRAAQRRYYWRNVERLRAKHCVLQKAKYWSDPEKSREYHRKRMAGKQLKANFTPEEWQRRLDMAKAAKARRDADPNYRAKRLAKQRTYFHKNKEKP